MAQKIKLFPSGTYHDGSEVVVDNAGTTLPAALSNINSSIAGVQSDMDVLDARMDTFVQLPTGSTSADAELMDIRVANSGKVYPTAGDAVRGQVDLINKEFSTTALNNYEMPFLIVSGSQVASSTGVISSSTRYSRFDYTDLRDCESFTISTTGKINFCLYDENKVYITGSASLTGMNRPANAKYIICTYRNANISSAVLTLQNVRTPISKIEYDAQFAKTDLSDSVITSWQVPINIIPNSQVTSSTGIIEYSATYSRSDYTELRHCETFDLSGEVFNICYYRSDKTFISGYVPSSLTGITPPSEAYYLIYTGRNTTIVNTRLTLYNAQPTALYLNNKIVWCKGKRINWIGDSIVAGADFDEEVCSALNLTETDYGINGSTIAIKEDGTDGRNALCLRYTNMTNDTDMIAVSCGTNDFQYAWCPIGTINSTANNTFYGALKTLCEGLINKYPQKVIFFTTPIKRAQPFTSGAGGDYTQDGVMTTPFSKNKYGKTLMDYCDIIKEVCGYYSIPVLDMNRESLLNPHLASQQNLFDSEYTHPNSTGQKIMARRVAGWIMQLGQRT